MSALGSVVDRDLHKLAPKFQLMVAQCLEMCHNAGLDAVVWEAYRSTELQALYYRRGRPPTTEYPRPVTSAKTNEYSWHGYGLAVDVISQKEKWFNPDQAIVRAMQDPARQMYLEKRRMEGEAWFARVAAIFKRCGCDWGGDWQKPHQDPPHFQFGRLKATPSDRARELLRQGGMEAVWRVVGAV